MRASDLLLFGPPLVLGAFIWAFSEYAIRSGRKLKAELAREGVAGRGRSGSSR